MIRLRFIFPLSGNKSFYQQNPFPCPYLNFISRPENPANRYSNLKKSKFHYAMSLKTVLQFRSQSTNPTSPISESAPNCLLRASFCNSLSSNRTWHSQSSFLPRCSSMMSLTAKSSRPRFRHSRSRCCQCFQFQFLGSWS